ncbi:MAG: amino acid ABC transporter substrate-binding protein, partial [Burkholderiales bacterium]
DFCRAVAAAALGDAEKVAFIPLRAPERFPALQARTIDLLVRNTSWTLLRETALRVRFAGILFYDGEGFMVPRTSGIKTLAGLKGATVCVVKGSTSVPNMADYSAARGLDLKPLIVDSAVEAAAALFAGSCRSYTSAVSVLASMRLRAPGGPQDFVMLPERISKEPLGPVVRSDDEDWLLLVRWVLFALIESEELGITRDNIRERIGSPEMRRMADATRELGKILRIDGNWAVRAVQSVGNYGEMFERNVGAGSPLKLERGLNRPWTQGGLMYAPPMR